MEIETKLFFFIYRLHMQRLTKILFNFLNVCTFSQRLQ